MSRRIAKRVAAGVAVIALASVAVVAGCVTRPMAFAGKGVPLNEYEGHPIGVPPELRDADAVSRGKYLALAADCAACHTAEGGQAFAGGRPFKTKFGTLYSPNITPDRQSGIGQWSDADFIRAVHRGVTRNGSRLYPAFPYASFTYLAVEDVLAIKAYLFSLPAVRTDKSANDLAFPFNQRWLMFFWALLFNPDERFRPVPERGAEWNRGAYLVEALAHCGDCHTPRNPLQGLNNRRKFAGTVTDGWRAHNITADKNSGIGDWIDEQLTQYLSAGHAQARGTAAGPMNEVVDLSLQHLSPGDIRAMIVYLRSVPATPSPGLPQRRENPAPAAHELGAPANGGPLGKDIFEGACVSCHDWSGAGTLTPFATLTGARTVNDPRATNVVQVILWGTHRSSFRGTVFMPAFDGAYSDTEIAAVANYATGRFGAQASAVTAQDVAELRKDH